MFPDDELQMNDDYYGPLTTKPPETAMEAAEKEKRKKKNQEIACLAFNKRKIRREAPRCCMCKINEIDAADKFKGCFDDPEHITEFKCNWGGNYLLCPDCIPPDDICSVIDWNKKTDAEREKLQEELDDD